MCSIVFLLNHPCYTLSYHPPFSFILKSGCCTVHVKGENIQTGFPGIHVSCQQKCAATARLQYVKLYSSKKGSRACLPEFPLLRPVKHPFRYASNLCYRLLRCRTPVVLDHVVGSGVVDTKCKTARRQFYRSFSRFSFGVATVRRYRRKWEGIQIPMPKLDESRIAPYQGGVWSGSFRTLNTGNPEFPRSVCSVSSPLCTVALKISPPQPASVSAYNWSTIVQLKDIPFSPHHTTRISNAPLTLPSPEILAHTNTNNVPPGFKSTFLSSKIYQTTSQKWRMYPVTNLSRVIQFRIAAHHASL